MNIFGNEDEEPQTEDTKIISNSLGIDLGTLNTVIAKPSGDKFDLYQIPSVVAVKKDDPAEVLAVGEEAKKMLGRTPEDILAVRPLKKGVIENVVQAQALLIKAMQIGINEGETVGRIVIGIPGDASEVEKNAAEEIGRKAGAQNILVISEGLAAAIGAGLPIAEPNGTMVVDIGAGSTDIVIISLGGINDIETVRCGGDDVDNKIVELVAEKYDVAIGIHDAESAKIEVGMVHCSEQLENLSVEIIGKSLETNRPKKVVIDSMLVADAVEPFMQQIVDGLNVILERLSPELMMGVYNNAVAVGGSSRLRGLKERIFDEIAIPIEISEDPMTVVAKGTAIVAAEPLALEPDVRLRAMKLIYFISSFFYFLIFMDILGIDEAGRGSVLGPMVIAGVIVPEKMEKVLDRMGVKDSKRLTPNRRTILSRKLKKMFEYDMILFTAREIDEMRADGINLNEIEKNAMEELILRLKPEKAIVDAVDVKAERFQENLRKDTGYDVISEHKADDTYIQVSAASIIAKAERDAQIAEINKEFIKSGGIGSGYPSDPTTKKFLTNYTYDEMPDFVRRSWNTVAKMK